MTSVQIVEKVAKTSFWRSRAWWRVTLVSVLLVAAAMGTFFYRECSTATTVNSEGGTSTLTTCAPTSLTSPIVLFVVLTAVLLLWPYLSEFSIFGVGLKKQIEEAKIVALEAKQTADVAVEAATESADEAKSDFARTDAKVLAEAAEETPSTSLDNIFTDANEHTRLVGEAVTLWAILSDRLSLDTALRVRKIDRLGNFRAPNDPRMNFVEQHREVLVALRRLRNAVAHGGDTPDGDIKAGIQIMKNLLSELQREI